MPTNIGPILPLKDQILQCTLKDEQGLNDFQKLPDALGIEIPRVGITRFRLPLKFKHGPEIMHHDATASMYVHLSSGKTGINMSRLCGILQQEAESSTVDLNFMKVVLSRYRDELRDNDQDPLMKEAFLKLAFAYPLKQKSLKSNNWGWQYYPCEISAKQSDKGEASILITIKYEYSSTCPCSLSMAKQYERDFAEGKTTEGNGIGVAHGQRSGATLKIMLSPEGLKNHFFIPEIVELLRRAIPTETQSLVKRIDEQAFAIINGSNPMFVEHASKRLHQVLNNQPEISDWLVELEHWESLHSHNAAAVIFKGVAGGLRQDDLFGHQ